MSKDDNLEGSYLTLVSLSMGCFSLQSWIHPIRYWNSETFGIMKLLFKVTKEVAGSLIIIGQWVEYLKQLITKFEGQIER